MSSTVFSTTAFLALSASLFGQSYPPAQGPPGVSGTSFVQFPAYYLVTDPVEVKVSQKMQELNLDLAARAEQDGVKATLRASVQPYSPSMAQTTYPDRPNSHYVNIPHIITITVSNIKQKKAGVWIPYPWDRTVTVSTDVMVSCKGWETGNGEITISSQSQPPYLDPDPSFSEAAVNFFLNHHLTDRVNSKLREALRGVTVGSSSSGTSFACNCLSRDAGVAGNTMDDRVLWAKLPTFNSPFASTLTIRPTRIKRLTAHTFQGAVLYDPVESPVLELWAGFGFSAYQVPSIVEGQEISLSSMPAITIRRPGSSSSLVIIASLTHLNRGIEDNAFRLFSSATDFGAGTQTIVIHKTYWKPATVGTKPIKFTVAAYEITFQVQPQGVFAPPGGGVFQKF